MLPTASILAKAREGISSPRAFMKKLFLPILLILSIIVFLCAAIGPLNALRAQSDNITVARTSATVNESCNTAYYSHDGNPFQLCPGPFPTTGGNCVWWAWEQWHLLGYDLPLNWGNAADWIVDAERAGLSVGKEPHVGSIAVFPRADGVWAYGTPGHVAFVTSVNDDAGTFNVTYQNYGDPKPMYIGLDYPVNEINAARFQKNEMRFIYFPTTIDSARFAALPGLHGDYLAGIQFSNRQLAKTGGASHLTVGLPNGSGTTEQEFNADFTGNGLSDLLLYNRKQGSLSIMSLTPQKSVTTTKQKFTQYTSPKVPVARRVMLSDAETLSTGWGTNLDIRVGNFAGTRQSDILLYDRTDGTIQLLTLTPQLTIQKHVSLPGWGPNWELYTGRFDGQHTGLFMYNRLANTDASTSLAGNAQTGTSLQRWQIVGRTASAIALDFNANLGVSHFQQFTQWHNSWEIYIGRYKNANQDGIFLYDRKIGEARVLDFNANMAINDYQEMHGLRGNWQVYSGDFNGSGRAQVMLYEPSKGIGAFLVLASDLSLVKRQDYKGWTPNEVLYVGHFGTDRLNAMLYNPQTGTSTFIVFNNALKVQTTRTLHSWDQHYQILVGNFVDRSTCIANGSCSKGDDILVLNRKTGQVQQYIFSFGRQYQVINNIARPYTRNGPAADHVYKTVDTTTFKIVGTFNTTIKNEELY